MSTGSRGNLQVHNWRKAEGIRAESLTAENEIRDERLDELEDAFAELRAELDALKEAFRGLVREL